MNIENLPEEILSIIFEYVDKSDKLKLLLVCHHWRELMERDHIFNKLNFFQRKRSEKDFALISNSKRKFRAIEINTSSDNLVKPEKVKRILKNNEKTLKELYWNLGNEREVLEHTFEYFYELLSSFVIFETIFMSFVNYEFDEKVDEPDRGPLEFKKLKNLDIKWKRTDVWYGDCNLEEEFKQAEAEISRVLEEAKLEADASVRTRPPAATATADSDTPTSSNATEQLEAPPAEEEEDANENAEQGAPVEDPNVEFDDTDDEERELEDVIARNLLPEMRTPNLRKLRIDTPGYNFPNALKNILNFINGNSECLESLYLYKENHYGFIWNPESLHVWYSPEVSEEIDQFLPGKCGNLKQFKLHCKENKNLAIQIFNEAKNLEQFETSAFIPLFFAREVFPQVKILTIWKLDLTRNRILKIHLNFPNVEVLRFAYVDVSTIKKEKKLFHDTFTRLKEIQYYNKTSKFYDTI